MLMTVNIKLSIIVIAEIIPSTDDTCLHQSISPQNGPSKVNCTWTGGIPNSTSANHQCESIASIQIQKLAFNIKHDSKSFYAYVRSKQKVQDKVGPLEDSDGNIITEGFLMAENLN